jgi:hypothetical protein
MYPSNEMCNMIDNYFDKFNIDDDLMYIGYHCEKNIVAICRHDPSNISDLIMLKTYSYNRLITRGLNLIKIIQLNMSNVIHVYFIKNLMKASWFSHMNIDTINEYYMDIRNKNINTELYSLFDVIIAHKSNAINS